METLNEFFEELGHRGHEPLLERITATIRWDILDGDRVEQRSVHIEHGDLSTASGDVPADCVITAERAVCEELVSGRLTSLAAVLRGAAAVDGDPRLAVLGQRLFRRSQPAASGPSGVPAERTAP